MAAWDLDDLLCAGRDFALLRPRHGDGYLTRNHIPNPIIRIALETVREKVLGKKLQ